MNLTPLDQEPLRSDQGRAERAVDQLARSFPRGTIERVLLVVPPDADASLFNFETAKRGRYWNYPPYGGGVIASHLRRAGVTVDILNLNNTILRAARVASGADAMNYAAVWKEALRDRLDRFVPDLVGISVMFSQTHQSARAVLSELKRIGPGVPVAMGGVHITNSLMSEKLAPALLADLKAVDFLFTYEAELAFSIFVNVVNRQAPADALAQTLFNVEPEKLFFDRRVTPTTQDELDVAPALDLMDVGEVSRHGTIGSFYCLLDEGTRVATILSNRGCRARCTFCSVRNFNGAGVRSRSVQSVIDELKLLRDRHGIGHVMWLDDDLLIPHARALELFNEMVRQHVGITWDCTNGVIAASCTEELMSAAVESGCIGLNIGVESGNPKILREIRKPGTVATFIRAAEVLRRHPRINARVFLMIGFPGETYRMILDTIDLAREMALDWYNVTLLQPLPNTPIFDAMVAQGLLSDVAFADIRYNTGSYGKHRKYAEEKHVDLLSTDFKDAFSGVGLDEVPARDKLDDIWAYMNYHLNFRRLFSETRHVKLMQQYLYVKNIADLVAPENAFAMYFAGYLQQKMFGSVDRPLISRLEKQLRASCYWRDRFDDFQLRVDHLRAGVFEAG